MHREISDKAKSAIIADARSEYERIVIEHYGQHGTRPADDMQVEVVVDNPDNPDVYAKPGHSEWGRHCTLGDLLTIGDWFEAAWIVDLYDGSLPEMQSGWSASHYPGGTVIVHVETGLVFGVGNNDAEAYVDALEYTDDLNEDDEDDDDDGYRAYHATAALVAFVRWSGGTYPEIDGGVADLQHDDLLKLRRYLKLSEVAEEVA